MVRQTASIRHQYGINTASIQHQNVNSTEVAQPKRRSQSLLPAKTGSMQPLCKNSLLHMQSEDQLLTENKAKRLMAALKFDSWEFRSS
jgi:hypothetical protein